jgi:hypothetical protein
MSAFAGVPHPGNDRITKCTGEGPDEVAAYFRGRTRESLAVGDVRHQRSALFWFSEDALLYYLPAYLNALAENPDEADITNDILWKLSVPSGHKPRDLEAFHRLIARLTQPQRKVIIRVFNHLRSREMCSDEDIAALQITFGSLEGETRNH